MGTARSVHASQKALLGTEQAVPIFRAMVFLTIGAGTNISARLGVGIRRWPVAVRRRRRCVRAKGPFAASPRSGSAACGCRRPSLPPERRARCAGAARKARWFAPARPAVSGGPWGVGAEGGKIGQAVVKKRLRSLQHRFRSGEGIAARVQEPFQVAAQGGLQPADAGAAGAIGVGGGGNGNGAVAAAVVAAILEAVDQRLRDGLIGVLSRHYRAHSNACSGSRREMRAYSFCLTASSRCSL